MSFGALGLALAVAVLGWVQSAQDDEIGPPDPVEIFDNYCLAPDGDHVWTWSLAAGHGYAPLDPAEFDSLRLPGARQLRGFTKDIDGVTVRILTSVNHEGGTGGTAYYRRCFVSVSRGSRDEADRKLRSLLGVRHFRFEQTFLYAWLPQGDGQRHAVSSNAFRDDYARLSNEQGLRYVTNRQYGSSVFLGYASPRTEDTYMLND